MELEEGMKLYQFPYSNVHPSGSVCTGRVVIPEFRTLKDLETFHVLFLQVLLITTLHILIRNQLESYLNDLKTKVLMILF